MNGRYAKVLVADDDIELRSILSKIIKKMDYDVSTVEDGQKTLQALATQQYDLCFLDINMPGKSGLDVLKELKKNTDITTSVIMITGNNDNNTIVNVMRLGADDYLQKPFEINEIQIAMKQALKNHHIKLENIRYKKYLEEQVELKTKKIKTGFLDMITAVARAIETRDNYTGQHVKRVSEFSLMIAEELNFTPEKLEEIKIGGILHDLGKIGVPDSILNKPGPLTKEEMERIKQHPQIGYEVIKDVPSLKFVANYVLYHHEKYDGTGYPKGLKGKQIPIEGRILALADALDAMTTDRPYKKAFSPQQAHQEIIRNTGYQFDPDIVIIFNHLWEKKLFQSSFNQKKNHRKKDNSK